jgi:3-hydroxy-9,10-secoandrosta-1,3,5(10)-triene-9,17-dione monooxygenase
VAGDRVNASELSRDSAAPDLATLLQRATALAPVLAERAANGETLRRMPDETIADLIDSKLLRICQPARFGGSELDWVAVCEASLALASGDCSQAWVANVYAEHAYLIALFADEAQHEVWDPSADTLVAASIVPHHNPVERFSGGWRLSGRWSFASGLHHARWVVVANVIENAERRPDHLNFLIPAPDYAIDDDWYTMGMAGTGSATIVLDDVFVPDHRTIANSDMMAGRAPGAAVNTAPLYRMPLLGFAQLALCSVPVGTALGMVEDFAANIGAGPGSEIVSERLSEAAAETRAATLLVLDSARRNMERLSAGATLDETDAALTMRDSAYAMILAKRAAARLFESSGGRGQYLSAPIQRAFRDIQTCASHGSLNWPRSALRYARSVTRGNC